jgi:hypothetical protein
MVATIGAITSLFPFCPTSPPLDRLKGPTLTKRRVHESVLGASATIAVGCEAATVKNDSGLASEFVNQGLDRVMTDVCIRSDGGVDIFPRSRTGELLQ